MRTSLNNKLKKIISLVYKVFCIHKQTLIQYLFLLNYCLQAAKQNYNIYSLVPTTLVDPMLQHLLLNSEHICTHAV
jgi:hypothetical protein